MQSCCLSVKVVVAALSHVFKGEFCICICLYFAHFGFPPANFPVIEAQQEFLES